MTTVQVTDPTTVSDAYDWAQANTKHEWSVGFGAIPPWEFVFEDDNEAMLFKLMWG